jgi:hypothetical protein
MAQIADLHPYRRRRPKLSKQAIVKAFNLILNRQAA